MRTVLAITAIPCIIGLLNRTVGREYIVRNETESASQVFMGPPQDLLFLNACVLMKWAVTRLVESDAIDKYPFFDKNKHLFRLNSCKNNICGDKMESYISRWELALFGS